MENKLASEPLKMAALQSQVDRLLSAHPACRVISFEFDGGKYWLKQPECLQGAMRLLKPKPQRALQNEIQLLAWLGKQQAPVPRLVLTGDAFFCWKMPA